MKFWYPPKGEPVEIKMLEPTPPFYIVYDRPLDQPFLCAIFDCPLCWLAKETKYAQHELDRWADDGGR